MLGNETHQNTYEDSSGTIVNQSMTFNAFNPDGNPAALTFHVPAHDNYYDFTVLMHAHSSGYWHHGNLEVNYCAWSTLFLHIDVQGA